MLLQIPHAAFGESALKSATERADGPRYEAVRASEQDFQHIQSTYLQKGDATSHNKSTRELVADGRQLASVGEKSQNTTDMSKRVTSHLHSGDDADHENGQPSSRRQSIYSYARGQKAGTVAEDQYGYTFSNEPRGSRAPAATDENLQELTIGTQHKS